MTTAEADSSKQMLSAEAINLAALLTKARTKRVVRRAEKSIKTARSQQEIWATIRAAAYELFEHIDSVAFAALRGDVIELEYQLAELKGRKMGRNKGHVGWVMRNRRIRYEPSMRDDDPDFEKEAGTPLRTIFTLPIRCDAGDVPGAVQLRSTEPNAFPDEVIRKAFCQLVRWAGERSVLAELRRALRESQLKSPESAVDWRQDILDLLLGPEAELSDLLRTKWKVARRFAEELKRIGGDRCIASSVRVYNSQSGDLSYVVCLGEAWTPEAREKAYGLRSQYDPSKGNADEESGSLETSESVKVLGRKKSAGRRALLQKEPVYYDTVEGREYDPVLAGTCSLWAKRFLVNEVVRGVVSVDWNVPDGAHEEIQKHLDAMVTQFEMVLNSLAGREELVYRRVERSVRSNDEEGLRKMTREIAEIFDAGHCSVFVDRSSSEELRLLASTYRIDAREIQRTHYPFGQGITGWVAKHKKTLCLRDPNDADEAKQAAERHGIVQPPQHTSYDDRVPISGFLAAPMVARGRVVGVVRLGDFEKNEFANEAEAFLQEISNRLGQELDRIWIEAEASKQVARLERRPIDLADCLRAAIDEAAESTNASGAYVRLHDRQLGLEVFETYGILQRFQNREPLPVELRPDLASDIWREPEWEKLCKPIKDTFGPDARDLVRAGAIFQLDLAGVNNVTVTFGLVFRVAPKWMAPPAQGATSIGFGTDVTVERLKSRAEGAILPALHLARTERKLGDELKASQLLLEASTCATTVAEVAEAFYKSALDESRMEVGVVRLYDSERKLWRRAAPVRVADADSQIFPDELLTNNALRRCMESTTPIFEPDVQAFRGWKADWDNEPNASRRDFLMQVRSWVAIPLWDGKEFIGGIFLQALKVQAPSDATMRHLALLAPIAARALRTFLQQRTLEMAEPFAMLGTMLGGFLHQERNALTAASGFCDNLQNMKGLPEVARERLTKLEQSLKIAGTVCRDIACFNLRDQASPERLSLNDLADEAWGNLARSFDLSRYDAVQEFDPSKPRILGNRLQIETAIRMLIQNALEALDEATTQNLKFHPAIRLQTKVRNKTVTLKIADSGCGMDSATRNRALRPFFTTKPTGSGLGLAIVERVARGHGAQVIVTSRRGWGTSISIRFALAGCGNG